MVFIAGIIRVEDTVAKARIKRRWPPVLESFS